MRLLAHNRQANGNDTRLAVLRSRLCSLSWFMKSLSEPIALRANAEDHCKGRFWERRFRSRVLLDETAVLSAMTYVDLNPIRAGMTAQLEGSLHTSIVQRIRELEAEQQSDSGPSPPRQKDARYATTADQPADLPPILGIRGRLVTCISTREYIELVDATGRQWHPTKRGRITGRSPPVLIQLGIAADQWVKSVRAVKPEGGFCRAVGSEAALLDKAAAIGQRWLRGLGIARSLAT